MNDRTYLDRVRNPLPEQLNAYAREAAWALRAGHSPALPVRLLELAGLESRQISKLVLLELAGLHS